MITRRTFLTSFGFTVFAGRNIKPAKARQAKTYIEIGAGEYNTPIVLSDTLRAVYGQGEDVTVFTPSSGQTAVQRLFTGSGYDSGFNVEGLTIKAETQAANGIEITGNSVANRVNDVRVRNVCFNGIDRGLKISYGANVITSDCKYIDCNRGQYFHETADIRIANVMTQLCKDYGTLVTGQTLPYNEGLSAVGLIDNGSRVGFKASYYDYLWLSACSFSSAKENAFIGEAVHNLTWAGGEVSNTLGQGSGIVTDSSCQRWLMSNILFDNITLFGIVMRGQYHHLAGSHFVNINNVPIYVEATDSRVYDPTFENTGTSWIVLEANGANRNAYSVPIPPIGKQITLIGAQSRLL